MYRTRTRSGLLDLARNISDTLEPAGHTALLLPSKINEITTPTAGMSKTFTVENLRSISSEPRQVPYMGRIACGLSLPDAAIVLALALTHEIQGIAIHVEPDRNGQPCAELLAAEPGQFRNITAAVHVVSSEGWHEHPSGETRGAAINRTLAEPLWYEHIDPTQVRFLGSVIVDAADLVLPIRQHDDPLHAHYFGSTCGM